MFAVYIAVDGDGLFRSIVVELALSLCKATTRRPGR